MSESAVLRFLMISQPKTFSSNSYRHFCRAMLCKHSLCHHAVSVCVSVRLSVTFVDSVKMNKHIFRKFPPSASHTILVFLYQTSWQYSDRNIPNVGIECRWGRQKWRLPTSIWLHRLLSVLRPDRCYRHGAAGPCQVVTLIAGSKRRNLLMAGDDDKMFMTRSQRYTKDSI